MAHDAATSPVVRTGIYTRISYDSAGQRAGVERQRCDCEALCRARGWEVSRYLEDNDRSVYNGKPRAAYQQMLAAIEDCELDAVVAWHNDRLHRSPKELESFIDLVDRSGVRVAVVSGGDYDLTSPDGRLAARIVGAVARKESEDRSRRVRRKHLELAEQGRPAGQLGWGVRDESERELVREAARRVLAGHGLMTVARDWNARHLPAPTASPWSAKTLRKVLLSARIAGLREHGVDRSGKVLGTLSAAVWQGAIDRRTWERVRSVLLNPERLTTAGTPTRYPLKGIIFCGVGGARLQARPRCDGTKRYVCAGQRLGHQLGVVARPVDELVASRGSTCSPTPTCGGRWHRRRDGPTTTRWGAPSPPSATPRAGCRPSATSTTSGGRCPNAGTARSAHARTGRSSGCTASSNGPAASASYSTPTLAACGRRPISASAASACGSSSSGRWSGPPDPGGRFDPSRLRVDIPVLAVTG